MEENNEKVKIIKFAALNLRKDLADDKDSARLSWSMRGEYPRVTVYTSSNNFLKEDRTMDYNFVIIAPFDIVTFMYFLQTLAMVANQPKSSHYSINCLNTKVENGVRTNETIVQAIVSFGKDDNGVIYLSVTEDGKRKVKFDLLPNTRWFKYQDGDGNTITDKAFLSKMFTLSYIETLKRLMLPKYSQYASEVLVDKPNIVKETKNETRKEKKNEDIQQKENKSETNIQSNGSSDKGESTIKVDESKLQDLKKVPEEEKPMDADFEALLNM